MLFNMLNLASWLTLFIFGSLKHPTCTANLSSAHINGSTNFGTLFDSKIQSAVVQLKSMGMLRTTLKRLDIGENHLQIYWNLDLMPSTASEQNLTHIQSGHRTSHFHPIEWTIRMRKFGSLYVKLRLISDTISIEKLSRSGNRTYHLQLDDLESGVAYELCLQCKDFPVVDQASQAIRRLSILATSQEGPDGRRFFACKELITKRSGGLAAQQVAVVSAVSSTSTVVIVVVLGCCCPKWRGNRLKGVRNQEEATVDTTSNRGSWMRKLTRCFPRGPKSGGSLVSATDKLNTSQPCFFAVKYTPVGQRNLSQIAAPWPLVSKTRKLALFRVQSWPQDLRTWQLDKTDINQ